mmetsp:Transcript_109763/g.306909  ORF Transcript_109763/g.306909 Transcript_109763/m.306909 type:complete len:207 (-) Transcript_109763:12-632(-)
MQLPRAERVRKRTGFSVGPAGCKASKSFRAATSNGRTHGASPWPVATASCPADDRNAIMGRLRAAASSAPPSAAGASNLANCPLGPSSASNASRAGVALEEASPSGSASAIKRFSRRAASSAAPVSKASSGGTLPFATSTASCNKRPEGVAATFAAKAAAASRLPASKWLLPAAVAKESTASGGAASGEDWEAERKPASNCSAASV